MTESNKPTEYLIAVDEASAAGLSLATIIAARRCYSCRQGNPNEMADSDPTPLIERVASECSSTSDYLLPDTPLKEAIFREILAGGNEPRTAEDISEALSARWAMATYPRDIASEVIDNLLAHSQGYGVAAVPQEQPDEEPEETANEPSEPVDAVFEGGEEPGDAGDHS